MGQRLVSGMLVAALALSGAAAAEEDNPFATGWYLEEFETSGVTDMFLYWFDADLGLHTLQFNCQKGFGDVVITAFMDAPDTEPETVVLASGEHSHVLEAISGDASGRWSTGGITSFTPELMDIVTGQFSVSADGVEQGRYSAKGATDKFAAMFEACPAA